MNDNKNSLHAQSSKKSTFLNCILNKPAANSIHMLAFNGSTDFFKVVQHKISPIEDVDFTGKTPLMYAVSNPNNTVEFVSEVLKRSNIHAVDYNGFNALYYAETFGNDKVKELIKASSVQEATQGKKCCKSEPMVQSNTSNLEPESTSCVSAAISVGIFSMICSAVMVYTCDLSNNN